MEHSEAMNIVMGTMSNRLINYTNMYVSAWSEIRQAEAKRGVARNLMLAESEYLQYESDIDFMRPLRDYCFAPEFMFA